MFATGLCKLAVWIVDAGMKLVEVYTRQDEKFARHGVFGTDDTFISPVLDGKIVNVDAIMGN